jgi:predicted GIY-YIG superfamily endonuclease
MSENAPIHRPSTRNRGAWQLVYQGVFATLPEARRREAEIKSWKSARLIRRPIKPSKNVTLGLLIETFEM